MCTVELGLLPPSDDDERDALKNGVVTFGAFIAFGSVPLLPYGACLAPGLDVPAAALFACSCALVLVALVGLGVTKAKMMRGNLRRDALKTLANGGAVALVAYLVAWGLERALGL